ncbi:MAG: hypothetical protein VW709_04605, partial [Rickettsiales bacterium]
SLHGAESDYGVVIADEKVDAAATAALRESLRRAHPPSGAHFDFGPEREAYERQWTPAAYNAMTEILAGLPVHWRFFVKARIFDAMNASASGGEQTVRDAFAAIAKAHPQIGAGA